jgi:hypothetical protein
LSLPVLYKFYARFINLAAGPNFDIYMGRKQKNKNPELRIDSYDTDPDFRIGFMAKASKRINLSETFVMEPEVRFNLMLGSGFSYTGFGIAGKYRL